jgi:cyclase
VQEVPGSNPGGPTKFLKPKEVGLYVNGGTLKGALEALDGTMKLAGPNTRLIPGHGTFTNRTDIVPYRDLILVQAKVQRMIKDGKREQEALAAKVTAAYDREVPADQRRRFVSMVHSQLKGGK